MDLPQHQAARTCKMVLSSAQPRVAASAVAAVELQAPPAYKLVVVAAARRQVVAAVDRRPVAAAAGSMRAVPEAPCMRVALVAREQPVPKAQRSSAMELSTPAP
jgi:hypothetical protein